MGNGGDNGRPNGGRVHSRHIDFQYMFKRKFWAMSALFYFPHTLSLFLCVPATTYTRIIQIFRPAKNTFILARLVDGSSLRISVI